jgi:hypothetical protein
VRTDPEGDYLAAYQREHGFVLTFLIQHGLGFDLAAISGGEGDWARKAAEAEDALLNDKAFESLFGPILARYLAGKGLQLEGYSAAGETAAIPLAEVEQLAARYIYPDGLSPAGQLQVHVCTNLNGASELPLGQDLVLGAFVFAAVRNHSSEILPGVERAIAVAEAFATSPDPAVSIARAQGAIWSHLISSGVLRRAILDEWRTQGPYFPFEMVEGETRPTPSG